MSTDTSSQTSHPSSKTPQHSKSSNIAGIDDNLHRTSPAGFAEKISAGRWETAPHLEILNFQLTRLAGRHIKRLMVCMPPRHGKSELCSRYFPPWYLTVFPDHRVILTSYEASFAASWGKKARNILEEHGEDYRVEVSQDSRAKAEWSIKGREGGMTTAGVGGPIMGRGGDLMIIDDPVKNAEQANSPVFREKAKEWYRSTFYTRKEPGCVELVIMTRWHEDDLGGWLLKEAEDGGEPWELLELPAISDHDHDAMSRAPGSALWAERYPLEKLQQIQRQIGPYWFNALYQQRPQSDTGGMFRRDWFRYFRVEGSGEDAEVVLMKPGGEKRFLLRSCAWRFQTIDTAMKTGQDNDYTAIVTFFVTPEFDRLIWEVWRDKLEVPDQFQAIWAARHRQEGILFQAVEDKASGIGLIQEAERRGLPFKTLEPETDKKMRATPLSISYQLGKVYHRSGALWLPGYEGELLEFPFSTNDDRVDCAAYGELLTRELFEYEDDWIDDGLGDRLCFG